MENGATRTGRLAHFLALGVVLSLVTAGALGATPAAGATQTDQPDVDNTVTRIRLHANGSAQWTVRIRTRLDTERESQEYEAFRSAVRENASRLLDPFETRMRRVVAAAANETGREMRAQDFSVSVSVQELPRRWGVVTYEFTWTGFAVRNGRTVAMGDVFEGGFFLAANDTLEVVVPERYTVTSVTPPPATREGDTLVWIGREDFADGRPSVRAVAGEGGTEEPAGSPSRSDRGASTPTQRSGSVVDPGSPATTPAGSTAPISGSPSLIGGIVIVVLLGGAGAYLLARRRRGGSRGSTREPEHGADGVGTPDSDEMMTDSERVERLLERHDGRMRQADIASELGWSASKTSRTVSRMVEASVVEKLQLGRENLIELRDGDEQ